jgi:hypothetical protein
MRRALASIVAAVVLGSCGGQLVQLTDGPQPSPGVCGQPVAGHLAFRDPAGGCLPSTTLESVQCDPAMPAVLVRWSGTPTERRYLGGDYRVPVGDLPTDAVPIAQDSTGSTVYARPHAKSWLWVDDGIGITRWLALPPAVPWQGRPPSAYFIGDSITQGASSYITAAMPGWTTGYDAVIGRPSIGGVAPAQTAAAMTPRPDALVVELGTNDIVPADFRANAGQILATLADVPLVLWQTVHSPITSAPEIDAAIRSLVQVYPNTAISNWQGYVTKDMLGIDGIHPTIDHEGAMADLIVPLLDGWRNAVEGYGPTGCLPAPPGQPAPTPALGPASPSPT